MFGTSELVLLVVLGILTWVAYGFFSKKPTPNGEEEKKQTSKASEGKKPKPTEKKNRMAIFFGSQSGTAETFAQDLADEAKRYGYAAEAIDMEEYDREELQNEAFAVFLLATFGEGEPTDNAAEFYEWIMNKERDDEDPLEKVSFATFALGNRQYEHFCAIGRRVDKRLEKLGASRLLPHGEGDDDGTLENDYAEWKSKFWAASRKKFGLGPDHDEDKIIEFKPSFDITWIKYDKEKEEGATKKGENTPHSKYVSGQDGFKSDSKYRVTLAKVVANRELRQDISDGGSTKHIELDISKSPLTYVTADNLGIYSRNDFKLAGKVAARLGVHPKDLFSLKPKEGNSRKHHYPAQCSVQDALQWYCDFGALAKIKTVATFASYAENDKEKHELTQIVTNPEEREKFLEDKKSIWEVLEHYPSINIPFHAFVELVPRIQPRFYTISSSSKLSPSKIAITTSHTVVKLPRGRVHKGLCTTYLKDLAVNKDRVLVFVRASSFRLPKTITTPVIMVGPGTGVAPFRAFLNDAEFIKKKIENEEKKLGDWHLYFGCRNSKLDYIYKDEIEKAVEEKVLSKLHLAFSRQADEKVYVQHRLEQQAEEFWELMHTKKAYFYVCGGTAMGRDVRNCLLKVAQSHGKLSADSAQQYIKDLQTRGRYVQELWS